MNSRRNVFWGEYDMMEDHELDEPIILPFVVQEESDPPPDHDTSDDLDREEEFRTESFWAGRNHAMRRSARVAA
jgi:hypothetical protein